MRYMVIKSIVGVVGIVLLIGISVVVIYTTDTSRQSREPTPQDIIYGRKRPAIDTSGLDFLRRLALRVWVAEYNNGKVAEFLFNDRHFYDGRLSTIHFFCPESQIERPTLPGPGVDFWPFPCKPISVDYAFAGKGKPGSKIIMRFALFDGVERVFPQIVKALKENRLGSYYLQPSRAREIHTIALKDFDWRLEYFNVNMQEAHLTSYGTINGLDSYTYPILDLAGWKDTQFSIKKLDAKQMHRIKILRAHKARAQTINYDNYKIEKEPISLRIEIDVPRSFF